MWVNSISALVGVPKMTKLEDVIEQYIDYLSTCPLCGTSHIVLEEKLTRIKVFDYKDAKLNMGFESKPMIHYEFRCSACRHIFISETIDDGDWSVSWTLLGDVFATKRMNRLKADVITKSKIQSKLV